MTLSQHALMRYFTARSNEWRSTPEVIGYMTSPIIGLYPEPKDYGHLHDSHARRMLSADVQALNESDEFSGIIISGQRGFKLATKEEAERYLRSEVVEAARKLKRYHAMCRKAGMDGQIDFDGETVRVGAV